LCVFDNILLLLLLLERDSIYAQHAICRHPSIAYHRF